MLGERQQERDRRDQVRREHVEQQPALAQRLAHEPEVALLEVAQPAVDELVERATTCRRRSRAPRPAPRPARAWRRPARSPAPVAPPPITTTSKTSSRSRSSAARRCCGPSWLAVVHGRAPSGRTLRRLPTEERNASLALAAVRARRARRRVPRHDDHHPVRQRRRSRWPSPRSTSPTAATQIFQAAGDWLLIAFGWGFAVCFAVYVAGGVSGAHLNPAVTLAMALAARLRVGEGAGLHGRRRCSARSSAPRSSTSTTATRSAPSRTTNQIVRGELGQRADLQHLRHLPGAVLRVLDGPVRGPDDRHRAAGAVHLRGHRRVQRAGARRTSRR